MYNALSMLFIAESFSPGTTKFITPLSYEQMETKRLIFKVHLQWAHFFSNSINTATAAENFATWGSSFLFLIMGEMGKHVIPSQ